MGLWDWDQQPGLDGEANGFSSLGSPLQQLLLRAAMRQQTDDDHDPSATQAAQQAPAAGLVGVVQQPYDRSDDQPRATQVQWWGPAVEALKPGFEFGMDTLGARKGPQVPPDYPKGMNSGRFTEAMGWENAMKAKPWAENLQKNPAAADQLANNLLKKDVTKNDIEQWGNFYEEMFRRYPNNEQFFWRSQGLKLLKNRFPSAAPTSTLSICPPGWLCT
jgi:hypothetical protein